MLPNKRVLNLRPGATLQQLDQMLYDNSVIYGESLFLLWGWESGVESVTRDRPPIKTLHP